MSEEGLKKVTLDEMIKELRKRIKTIVKAGTEIDDIAFKARITGDWQWKLTDAITDQRHKYENTIKILEEKRAKNESKN